VRKANLRNNTVTLLIVNLGAGHFAGSRLDDKLKEMAMK
jgi:hypothetical protein